MVLFKFLLHILNQPKQRFSYCMSYLSSHNLIEKYSASASVFIRIMRMLFDTIPSLTWLFILFCAACHLAVHSFGSEKASGRHSLPLGRFFFNPGYSIIFDGPYPVSRLSAPCRYPRKISDTAVPGKIQPAGFAAAGLYFDIQIRASRSVVSVNGGCYVNVQRLEPCS